MRRVCSFFYIFLFLYSLTAKIQAQSSDKDSLVTAAAYASAVQQYHDYLAPETGLFRGSQYVDYAYQLEEGHPFFDQNHLRKGTILYDGVLYTNVSLLYDLVKQVLVINDPYNSFRIALNSGQVDSFTIETHIFFKLKDTLSPSAPRSGFYEQLYKGKMLLLKREKKTVQEQSSSLGFTKFIDHTRSWYIKKGGVYYSVNNKKSLLHVLKDRSKDIRKFIRKNSLDLKEDKDNTLIKVLAWYDSFNQ